MKEYDKLIELTNSEDVKNGTELPKIQLHKWLVLGQTQYVCENGTLADGHENLTPARKYAQAIKESYGISLNIVGQRAHAKRAKADLIEAEEALANAKTSSQILRAEASIEEAQMRIIMALTTVEDQMRMLNYYTKRADSLKEAVESKYPLGIEQAELDSWKTIYEFRMAQERAGLGKARIDNIPLDPVTKAQLGYEFRREDSIFPLAVYSPETCEKIGSQYQEHIKQLEEKLKESK